MFARFSKFVGSFCSALADRFLLVCVCSTCSLHCHSFLLTFALLTSAVFLFVCAVLSVFRAVWMSCWIMVIWLRLHSYVLSFALYLLCCYVFRLVPLIVCLCSFPHTLFMFLSAVCAGGHCNQCLNATTCAPNQCSSGYSGQTQTNLFVSLLFDICTYLFTAIIDHRCSFS